jgi:hypothetical protein
MTENDIQCNYATLVSCISTSSSFDKDVTALVNKCQRLHQVSKKVGERCHLPSLGGMIAPQPTIKLMKEIDKLSNISEYL